MEDGVNQAEAGAATATASEPPPPPNPNQAVDPNTLDVGYKDKSDVPLKLDSEDWDIDSISGLGALRMLMVALEQLAEFTGDVPPTPPASRPHTPRGSISGKENVPAGPVGRRVSSIDTSCASSDLPSVSIGSPEAHPHEPVTEIGHNADPHFIQHAVIARRFFSKVAPPFSLSEYLLRFHQYCPHSPGVYLAAAMYCHRLCVVDYMVPATNRTIHRLSLAAIRVAAKALEDNKWSQERVAKVGGINRNQLLHLEVTLCFLLDFDLWIDADELRARMYLLQQAARQGMGAKRLENFNLKMPSARRRFLSQG